MADAPDAHAPARKPPRDWHEDWLRVYAEKGTVAAACRAVRISRQNAYEHRKKFAEFAEAWEKLENEVTDQLEKTLVEVALEGSGSPQVRALEIALRGRRPERYGTRIDVSGKVDFKIEQETDERIDELVAKLESPGQAPAAG